MAREALKRMEYREEESLMKGKERKVEGRVKRNEREKGIGTAGKERERVNIDGPGRKESGKAGRMEKEGGRS